MSGANVCPGLVNKATMPKRRAEAACWRRFTTKSSSTRSEITSFRSLHVPSVNTRLLEDGDVMLQRGNISCNTGYHTKSLCSEQSEHAKVCPSMKNSVWNTVTTYFIAFSWKVLVSFTHKLNHFTTAVTKIINELWEHPNAVERYKNSKTTNRLKTAWKSIACGIKMLYVYMGLYR